MPQVAAALTACERLLLQRADKIRKADNSAGLPTFPDVSIDDLLDLIRQLEALEHRYATDILRPAGEAEVLEMLADFADFLQVSVPNEAGIDMYVAALEDIPAVVLAIAKRRVAKTHKFSKLPLPKDFIAAVPAELAWCESKKGWPKFVREQFARAITLRQRQERIAP